MLNNVNQIQLIMADSITIKKILTQIFKNSHSTLVMAILVPTENRCTKRRKKKLILVKLQEHCSTGSVRQFSSSIPKDLINIDEYTQYNHQNYS